MFHLPLFSGKSELENLFTLAQKYFNNKIHDKLSKGVSITSIRLPYTLKRVLSCPVTSNSKAA